ncbi:light harvesting complex protein [Tribonema minus]|uniref:Light harvesting complex protein n=1 Tax=Tribonema minus TaxID=303371 RepID=A0A835ZHI1_9STRA|nr:light harvesting complex protein [Tribonema minus]
MVLRPSADVGKSRALPFLQAPFFAGSDMTGDAGFDPLGFATEDNIDRMRECELKHGRLAMVALGGWPVAELVLGLLQRAVPPATVCTGSGCTVDSSLSAYALPLQAIGRFGAVYWASALALAIVAEVAALKRRQEWGPDLPLGDLGVDPFKLASDDMRLKELKHGRLAMAAFAVHYAGVLAKNKGVVFAHQMWSQVCVYNFRADLGFPAPICYPRPEAALDTVLSWEIMFRVLTGYFKEPYY